MSGFRSAIPFFYVVFISKPRELIKLVSQMLLWMTAARNSDSWWRQEWRWAKIAALMSKMAFPERLLDSRRVSHFCNDPIETPHAIFSQGTSFRRAWCNDGERCWKRVFRLSAVVLRYLRCRSERTAERLTWSDLGVASLDNWENTKGRGKKERTRGGSKVVAQVPSENIPTVSLGHKRINPVFPLSCAEDTLKGGKQLASKLDVSQHWGLLTQFFLVARNPSTRKAFVIAFGVWTSESSDNLVHLSVPYAFGVRFYFYFSVQTSN